MRHATHRRRTTGAITALGLALLTGAVRAEEYTFTKIADNTGPINLFGLPSINTGGTVAVFATLDAGGEAIYTGTGDGMLTTVAETGGLYKQLFTPAINDDGRVAFRANTSVADIMMPIPAGGIFSSKDGSTITIADNQPGSPYFDFGLLNRPSINATGVVAFFGQLRTADGFPSFATGIYTGVGGAHTTIADFSNGFGRISEGTSINATGTVAFAATRPPSSRFGVFTGMSAASTTVAGDVGEYDEFDNNIPSINDDGVVAFRAKLDEGGSGIYTGGVAAVMPVAETEDGEFIAFDDPAINADGRLAFAATRAGGIRGIFTGEDPADDKVIAVGDELFDSTLAGFAFQRGLNDNGEIAFNYRTEDGVRGIAVASPGTLTRTVDGGDGYDGVRVRSAEGGDTVARLRGGIAGDERSVELSYEPGGSFAINGGRPVGDVLSLAGTDDDVFVLELAYSDDDLATAGITNESDFFLQWLDPADDAWKNAVLGNTPSGGVAFPGASYDAYLAAHGGVFSLGDYGNDPASNTVWAVLNHNSLFAIAPVPEPSTWALLVGGLCMLAWGRFVRRLGRGPPELGIGGRKVAISVYLLLFAWQLPVGDASAQTKTWIGGTGSWFSTFGWSPGGAPDSSSNVRIDNGGTVRVMSAGAQASEISLGFDAGQSGTVEVSGASNLSTGFDIYVGRGGTGTLAIFGGGVVVSKFGLIGSSVNSMGTVNVTGAGSVWEAVGGSVLVGGNGTGSLLIASGGAVLGFDDSIGTQPGAIGTATVTGASSGWINAALRVGRFGTGTLRVESGAVIGSGSGIIGDQAASIGNVTVTGPGSSWAVGGNLPIGNLGAGVLTISDEGTVSIGAGAGQVSINALSTLNIGEGGAAGVLQAGALVNHGALNFFHTDAATINAPISGNGQINKVSGGGDTTLANVSAFTGSFSVQEGLMVLQGDANASGYTAAGGGTLRFAGGTVNLGLANIQTTASGAVEYDSANIRGGFLRGPGSHTILPGANPTTFNAVTTFNSAHIVQDGSAFLLNFTNGGTLTNNAPLPYSGGVNASTGVINVNSTLATFDVGNNGVIAVNSGGVINNFSGNLVSGGGSRTTIDSSGEINLLNGTTLELNGALLVNDGTINGTVNVHYGSLAKGSGAYDIVNVFDGGVFAPGNSPGIVTVATLHFDDASMVGGPTLAIELGGTTPGREYDQVQVVGELALAGTLAVSLLPGFNPMAGQSFDILDWGSLSGTFVSIQLPALAGLTWDTSKLYTTGVLSTTGPGLPGDYNQNGVVDAADYTVWRDGLGSIYTQADYEVWKSHFGRSAGSGGQAGDVLAAVPEPSSFVLCGGLAMVWRRRTRPDGCSR